MTQKQKLLHLHMFFFTERERAVYDYLLGQFTQAVKELSNLDKMDFDYDPRQRRISDRMDNHVFTARILGVNLDYDRDTYEIEETLWE